MLLLGGATCFFSVKMSRLIVLLAAGGGDTAMLSEVGERPPLLPHNLINVSLPRPRARVGAARIAEPTSLYSNSFSQ